MSMCMITGDALDSLKTFDSGSVVLIVTSPPYAGKRGGPKPDNYVKWFMPIAEELFRVLDDRGSFILNIKELAVKGERHTYVLHLILEMKRMGWRWVEEYIWHKKNSYPGKWPNRFRDSWERVLHFTKQADFDMYQEEVMVPIGDWSTSRLSNLSDIDEIRDESAVGSGLGKKVSNWKDRSKVYPTNVLHMATECGNKGHNSAFPESLPEWFVKLFTKPGGVVLDPFMGSGTVGVVCLNLGRVFVGIDIDPDCVSLAKKRLTEECGVSGK